MSGSAISRLPAFAIRRLEAEAELLGMLQRFADLDDLAIKIDVVPAQRHRLVAHVGQAPMPAVRRNSQSVGLRVRSYWQIQLSRPPRPLGTARQGNSGVPWHLQRQLNDVQPRMQASVVSRVRSCANLTKP